jgi:hypothetical protein
LQLAYSVRKVPRGRSGDVKPPRAMSQVIPKQADVRKTYTRKFQKAFTSGKTGEMPNPECPEEN